MFTSHGKAESEEESIEDFKQTSESIVVPWVLETTIIKDHTHTVPSLDHLEYQAIKWNERR